MFCRPEFINARAVVDGEDGLETTFRRLVMILDDMAADFGSAQAIDGMALFFADLTIDNFGDLPDSTKELVLAFALAGFSETRNRHARAVLGDV